MGYIVTSYTFRPDLVVCAPHGRKTFLAVEVKAKSLGGPPLRSLVEKMGDWMMRNSCHHGLIVTPSKSYILTEAREGNYLKVQLVAEIPTEKILRQSKRRISNLDEIALIRLIADWLEQMSYDWWSALPKERKWQDPFLPDFVAAVSRGEVRIETHA